VFDSCEHSAALTFLDQVGIEVLMQTKDRSHAGPTPSPQGLFLMGRPIFEIRIRSKGETGILKVTVVHVLARVIGKTGTGLFI
jgi:hypothetical protein